MVTAPSAVGVKVAVYTVEDVAEKLGVVCNRKFVKKVLDGKRSKSQLEKKLSKIS